MLNKLFGSNARVKILKLFLSHPEGKFYIRQIARQLNLQLNSVRRELDNLEAFGLLKSVPADENEQTKEEAGQDVPPLISLLVRSRDKKAQKNVDALTKQEKKFYQVDTNFVLYGEIKALFVKAQILYEKDFVEKLNREGSVKLLILTGFFVNNPDSPTDLLIVGRFNRKKVKELEEGLGREIRFTLLDTREYRYRREITDVFLYSILEGKKMVIINQEGGGGINFE